MSLKWAARVAFSLLLIASLLYRFDPGVIFSEILSAKVGYLLMAASAYAVTFLILSSRWRMILASMGEKLPVATAYQAFAGGMIISDLTPGRIGEFARPILVKDRVDLSRGMASVAIDRYADILTTFFLGLIGMLLLAGHIAHLALAVIFILLIVVFSLAFWFKRPFFLKLIDRFSTTGWGTARLSEIAHSLDRALNEVSDIKVLMIKSILITATAWIFHALRIVLIARSVGFDAPLYMLFLLQPLVSALALVPITISGLGLVEGGLAALLGGVGIPAASGISIALMDRAITVAFHILVGGRLAAKSI